MQSNKLRFDLNKQSDHKSLSQVLEDMDAQHQSCSEVSCILHHLRF
jgi:hypothetical protein